MLQLCVSILPGSVSISCNGTLESCSTCLSTLSCGCPDESGATSHSSGFTIAPEQGLSRGYCVGSAVLVPQVSLLTDLFGSFCLHVFQI